MSATAKRQREINRQLIQTEAERIPQQISEIIGIEKTFEVVETDSIASGYALRWKKVFEGDGYNIPNNMFSVVVLGHIRQIASEIFKDERLAERAEKLRKEIDFGIHAYGIVNHPKYSP